MTAATMTAMQPANAGRLFRAHVSYFDDGEAPGQPKSAENCIFSATFLKFYIAVDCPAFLEDSAAVCTATDVPVMPYWTARYLTLGEILQLALSTFGFGAAPCRCFEGDLWNTRSSVAENHVCELELPTNVEVMLNDGEVELVGEELSRSLLNTECRDVVIVIRDFAASRRVGPDLYNRDNAMLHVGGDSAANKSTLDSLAQKLFQQRGSLSVKRGRDGNPLPTQSQSLGAVRLLPSMLTSDEALQLLRLWSGWTGSSGWGGSSDMTPYDCSRYADTLDEVARQSLESRPMGGFDVFDYRLVQNENFDVNSTSNAILMEPRLIKLFNEGRLAVFNNRILPLTDPVSAGVEGLVWQLEGGSFLGYKSVATLLSSQKLSKMLDTPLFQQQLRDAVKPRILPIPMDKWLPLHMKSLFAVYEAYTPGSSKAALERFFQPKRFSNSWMFADLDLVIREAAAASAAKLAAAYANNTHEDGRDDEGDGDEACSDAREDGQDESDGTSADEREAPQDTTSGPGVAPTAERPDSSVDMRPSQRIKGRRVSKVCKDAVKTDSEGDARDNVQRGARQGGARSAAALRQVASQPTTSLDRVRDFMSTLCNVNELDDPEVMLSFSNVSNVRVWTAVIQVGSHVFEVAIGSTEDSALRECLGKVITRLDLGCIDDWISEQSLFPTACGSQSESSASSVTVQSSPPPADDPDAVEERFFSFLRWSSRAHTMVEGDFE